MSVPMRQVTVPHDEQEEADRGGWVMKKMNLWHKNVASLIAQGIPRETIATMMDCTPTYVSMLAKQPLMKSYIQEMSEFAGIQLEAQFSKAVTAIGDTLENGDFKSKMSAARLQAELTGRVGSRTNPNEIKPSAEDRLLNLAERLTGLLENKMATDIKVEAHALQDTQDIQIEDANFSDRGMSKSSSEQ